MIEQDTGLESPSPSCSATRAQIQDPTALGAFPRVQPLLQELKMVGGGEREVDAEEGPQRQRQEASQLLFSHLFQ